MGRPLRVLIVEDSEDDALLLARELGSRGYEPIVERVETADDMRAALNRRSWDIVVSDYSMPSFSGPAALSVQIGRASCRERGEHSVEGRAGNVRDEAH